MIIPKTDPERCNLLKKIVDVAFQSRGTRQSLYGKRRNYFLFGTNSGDISLHNRLKSMLDLVASFLYSPDHAQFALSAPRYSDDMTIMRHHAAQEHWNDKFRDSDLAFTYQDALLWSLIYDTVPIKMGWNDARSSLFGRQIYPGSVGVWREDEGGGDFDGQEAIVHRYNLGVDNAVQRLYRAGLKDKVKELKPEFSRREEDEAPSSFRQLMITGSASSDLSANITGTVATRYEDRATYSPDIHVPLVTFHEIWVWDDTADDYVVFTFVEPDIVLSDSRETVAALQSSEKFKKKLTGTSSNIFLPGEHPFIFIQPYPIYDYAWGECGIERAIPLQVWSDTRLREIQELLARQTDPAKVFSGFMGLQEEKAGALGDPGTWVYDAMPGAAVKELAPVIPEDLFREYNGITNLILECFGLTATVMGMGEDGVRGEAHAKQLAKTGSGRIQKTAIALERSLAKFGEIGVKLMQRNSDEKLNTEAQEKFYLSQLGQDWTMRVAGHSQSPLFRDSTRENALILFKAQAIDQADLIHMINPPNKDQLIASLKKRQAAKAKMMQQGIDPSGKRPPGRPPALSVVGG